MSSSLTSSSDGLAAVAAASSPAWRLASSRSNLSSSLRSNTRVFVCCLTTCASIKDSMYLAAVDVDDMAKTANSKANMTIMPGLGCSNNVFTQYLSISKSKASEIAKDIINRAWNSRGFVGGCCSSASTLDSLIHCHTFPASRLTNMTKNQVPTSSRKVVIARAVSVTAYHALSHNCSLSIALRGPYTIFCSPRMRP